MDCFIVRESGAKSFFEREFILRPRSMIPEEDFNKEWPPVVMIPPEMPAEKIGELLIILNQKEGSPEISQRTDTIEVSEGSGSRQVAFYYTLFGSLKKKPKYSNLSAIPGANYEHLILTSVDGKGAVVVEKIQEDGRNVSVRVFCLLPKR